MSPSHTLTSTTGVSRLPAPLLAMLLTAGPSLAAEVTYYTDRPLWESALGGAFQTITFTEHPTGPLQGDEYAISHGALFDPGYSIFESATYVNDGFGLYPHHHWTPLILTFDSPQRWLAVDHAGGVEVSLYHEGRLIAPPEYYFQNGVGLFFALVSDTPFDRVELRDPVSGVLPVDDLHFGGATVPAPAVLAVFSLAPLIVRGRRRSRRNVLTRPLATGVGIHGCRSFTAGARPSR